MTQAPQPRPGADATAPKEKKAKAAPKPPKEKKAPKYDPEATIVMGVDKDGKKYGKDNNPKRGASALRFAKYRDGMKVKDLEKIEGGPKTADLDWDTAASRKYIEIH